MIRIIVDSTCDLPEEILTRYNIKTLPLRVSVNGVDYLDKVTITVAEVYEAMRNGALPKTSLPKRTEAYEMLKECAIKGYNCLFLSLSSKLSGTYQVVAGVVAELKKQYDTVELEAIDSKAGSMATGLMALQAARLAAAGAGFKTVAGVMKELAEHVEHIFTISDLNWLIKGGRISKTEGLIGNLLQINPILHVNNGALEVIKKVRGKKKALHTVVDLVEERIRDFPDQLIGITHADDRETALEVEALLHDRLGKKKTMVGIIGSVLGTHLGIGGVGVFFFNKRPSIYLK